MESTNQKVDFLVNLKRSYIIATFGINSIKGTQDFDFLKTIHIHGIVFAERKLGRFLSVNKAMEGI